MSKTAFIILRYMPGSINTLYKYSSDLNRSEATILSSSSKKTHLLRYGRWVRNKHIGREMMILSFRIKLGKVFTENAWVHQYNNLALIWVDVLGVHFEMVGAETTPHPTPTPYHYHPHPHTHCLKLFRIMLEM